MISGDQKAVYFIYFCSYGITLSTSGQSSISRSLVGEKTIWIYAVITLSDVSIIILLFRAHFRVKIYILCPKCGSPEMQICEEMLYTEGVGY